MSCPPESVPPRARAVAASLLLAPVAVHVLLLARGAAAGDHGGWNRLDTLVQAAALLFLAAVAALLRRPRRALRAGVAVQAVFLPLALLEVWHAWREAAWVDLPLPPMRRVFPAPEGLPGLEGPVAFTIDSRGLRAPPVWPADRRDRVLCVGGSSVECLYVSDAESWPWRLGESLTAAAGRPVLVAGAGRSGHFTAHHEILLAEYRHADAFGLVLLQCGINDAGTLLRENRAARVAAAPREALVRRAGGVPYYHRLLVTRVLLAWRTGTTAGHEIRQDHAARWVFARRAERARLLAEGRIAPFPEGLPPALEAYRASLRRIAARCRDRGQTLVLVTQPTLYRADLRAAEEAMLVQYSDRGALPAGELERLLASYNRVMREVAEEAKLPCVDLASLLPRDDRVFYDDCHFHEPGCVRVADALAGALAPRFAAPAGADH